MGTMTLPAVYSFLPWGLQACLLTWQHPKMSLLRGHYYPEGVVWGGGTAGIRVGLGGRHSRNKGWSRGRHSRNKGWSRGGGTAGIRVGLGGGTAGIRVGLGGRHSRSIGLCHKGFQGSQDPLLRGARGPQAPTWIRACYYGSSIGWSTQTEVHFNYRLSLYTGPWLRWSDDKHVVFVWRINEL